TAGTTFSFTITALDKLNQTAYVYTNTGAIPPINIVHFSSTDSNAILPGDSFLLFGSGVFTMAFRTSGIQTLTAADNVNPKTVNGSAVFNVSPAVATHFHIIAPPSVTSASGFTITVQALDGLDNIATAYTGTVRFTSSDSAAGLPGPTTLTNGVGTFNVIL